MSRAERRRQARSHRRHDRLRLEAVYGVQVAWCDDDPASLAEAKQRTHDNLIEAMGVRRTGGVEWRISRGADAEQALAAMLQGACLGEVADYYRHIGALLGEHGGYFVVAMAEGTP